MNKKIVDMGILSAIFSYEVKGDVAVIHKLMIGGANAVEFPLTDWYDIKNFSEMLSGAIGFDVVVAGVEVV